MFNYPFYVFILHISAYDALERGLDTCHLLICQGYRIYFIGPGKLSQVLEGFGDGRQLFCCLDQLLHVWHGALVCDTGGRRWDKTN